MIVQSDFLTHWKVKALANRVGMEAALTALLALWAHCERRRAWEFELTPLMLAGICDFKGDAGELFTVMLELKLLEATDVERWYQVHEWGKVNAALVGKWVANKGKGWRWHPRGHACQSIDPSIDRSSATTADRPADATIGLDRIGEDRIGERESPGKPGGTSAESSMPEPDPGAASSDAAASKIPPGAKKKKGAAAEPEFPENVGVEYRHALQLWWHYKRERREGYKASGWAAVIRQQLRYPPEQVLASVEASMAANWAGLFTEKFGGAVEPGRGSAAAKKEGGGRIARDLTEPDWDWRAVGARLFGQELTMPWRQLLERMREDILIAGKEAA